MRTAIASQLQYRVTNYFYMLGMIAEPVVYLVVWTTIAEDQGGAVNGITTGEFAAYYIVWTLVRNMNIVFGAPFWEWRIREGRLAGDLLKPMYILHYDLAYFAGWKFVVVAIWGAYLIRSMFQGTIGMLNFWTTRGAAAFDLYMAVEMLLSGRLVPLQLMPGWVQTLANFLPFKWTFGYPIESLVGNLSTQQLLLGLCVQALWIGIGFLLFKVAWSSAIKRFVSVGN